jgi:phosphatidylserine decarboxylase
MFDTDHGPMALILVGAMLVSGLQTIWSGPVSPPHGQAMRTWRYDKEMGRFNAGSTVILLFPGKRVRWLDTLQVGAGVQMGEGLARLLSGSAAEG